jgi:asparaginyl-tRNA synthetase
MFNKRTRIKELLAQEPAGQPVIVMGWVRTFRNNQFIALNDGSTNNNLQIVVELGKFDDELLKRITASASLKVSGVVVPSLGKGQKMDLKAERIEVLGDSDPEKYPLQLKNRPSLEFLREKAHLRFRTNTFGSVFRVRHALAFAIHQFFNDRGFVYMHTPIITGSDAEGAGELFRVTTLPFDHTPRHADGEFQGRFFRPGHQPDRERAAGRRTGGNCFRRHLYLRPNFSCREQQYYKTYCGVLDDRT